MYTSFCMYRLPSLDTPLSALKEATIFHFGISFVYYHFSSPAQPVKGFTLNDLPAKPWPQVSFLPPGTCLQFNCAQCSFSIRTFQLFMLSSILIEFE